MDDLDLAFAGIARQAELVRAGEVSPRELVELSLRRIERHDPSINAFRVVFAELALAEASQAEGRARSGDDRPLLGVPVAIKDDVDVAGEVTGRGSRAHGPPAERDAEVVRLLRAAGAIVIGKTHVPELEQWPFTESAAWGSTRNPWAPGHVAGGSSGGSAAAVAAGMVGAALGSDGAGSVRIPAACCSLFGLKPQRGRSPHPQGWHGMSVVGPLVRRVADSALFLDVISEGGPVGRPPRPFTEALSADPPRLRIGVSRKVPPGIVARVDPEMEAATARTAELLRSLGHEVGDRDPDYGTIGLESVARYLRGIHDDAVAMPHPELLERRTKGMVRLGKLIPAAAFEKIRAGEAARAKRLNSVFEHVDLLLTPALARPPVRAGHWEGRGALGTLAAPDGVAAFTPFTAAWNAGGNPAAAVPAGFTAEGLPLSVQLVGRQEDEWTILALAGQMERQSAWVDARPEATA